MVTRTRQSSGKLATLDDVSKAIIEQLQQDGRRSYAAIGKVVGLSEAGEEKLRLVHERVIETLNEALATWSPEEIQTLVDGLVRLRADLADPTECASKE